MKNKIIIVMALLLCIGAICAVIIVLNKNNKKSQDVNNNQTTENVINTNSENSISNTNIESDKKMISNIKIIIDGKDYNATLEENETAQSFANLLPQELNMSELNGNEKYAYLDNSLPTNSYSPKHIEAGDIMLYGDNCLVVFYKSFDTSYSYTKIGHIDNLSDLGNKNVIIKWDKK